MKSQSLVLIFLSMASRILGNPDSPNTAIYYPEQTPTHVAWYPLSQSTKVCHIPDSYGMTDSLPRSFQSTTSIEYNTSSAGYYAPQITEMVTRYGDTMSSAWPSTHTQSIASPYSSMFAQDTSLASSSLEIKWIVWMLSVMVASIGVGIALWFPIELYFLDMFCYDCGKYAFWLLFLRWSSYVSFGISC